MRSVPADGLQYRNSATEGCEEIVYLRSWNDTTYVRVHRASPKGMLIQYCAVSVVAGLTVLSMTRSHRAEEAILQISLRQGIVEVDPDARQLIDSRCNSTKLLRRGALAKPQLKGANVPRSSRSLCTSTNRDDPAGIACETSGAWTT